MAEPQVRKKVAQGQVPQEQGADPLPSDLRRLWLSLWRPLKLKKSVLLGSGHGNGEAEAAPTARAAAMAVRGMALGGYAGLAGDSEAPGGGESVREVALGGYPPLAPAEAKDVCSDGQRSWQW